MKLIRRILRLVVIAVLALIAFVVVITAVYSERVAGVVLQQINSNSGYITSAGSARLSLVRHFPRASVIVNDILVKGPVAVNGNDTIASAASVSLGFRLINILRKQYIIEWLSVNEGRFNLLADSAGRGSMPEKNHISGTTGFRGINADLKNIRLTDFLITVSNDQKESGGSINVRSARLAGRIAGNDILLKASGEFTILRLSTGGINVQNPVDGRLDAEIHKKADSLLLRSGALGLGTMNFSLSGFYSGEDKQTTVRIGSEDASLRELSGFIPSKYGKWAKYKPSGTVSTNAVFEGVLSNEESLNYKIAFSFSDVSVDIPGTPLKLWESSLAGYLTNGNDEGGTSESLLRIDRLQLKTDRSSLSGSLTFSGFVNPAIAARLNTTADLSEIRHFSKSLAESVTSGIIAATLDFKGTLPKGESNAVNILASLNPRGNIWLSSLNIKAGNYSLADITGNLMLAGTLWADSLGMSINGQRILWTGETSNFIPWIKGDADLVSFRGSVASPSFSTAALITSGGDKRFAFPGGYLAEITFSAGEFMHAGFSAWDATGIINYSGRQISIDNLSMRTLGGEISGSGAIKGNSEEGFITETALNLSEIDIKQAFTSFNNFGQDFIKADNLGGSLSGAFAVRMGMDGNLRPVTGTLASEGRFVIDNGELIGFPPVMSMSKYIEISELEEIKFSRLENEFFIKEGVFAIPQMDIRSSAADLGVSGKYGFNGDYEFHLRILLSQLLSRKAPDRSQNNEFGVVEDDGLGRTTLYLLVSRTGSKEVIAYDTRAVRSEVKESLQKEKQTLKGILKDEFGWYGKDTTVLRPTEKKPGFRIRWDETVSPDTIVADTIPGSVKGGPVRNLFRKIIKGQPGEYLPQETDI